MKKDIGFWNEQGEYIPDIQEVNEVEMDKEIIIDGVDVAGCEFIGDIKNKFVKCTSWVHNSKKQVSGHWDCRENKNCYYKQIKRLEQENAELKTKLSSTKCYLCGESFLAPEGAELYEENARLKEEIEIRDNLSEKFRKEALSWANMANEYQKDKIKLEQTLQEIKKIAEPFAKCYTHACRNCEKYDSAHACCLKDIHCYKYNDGSKSSCKDFVLPTKQFYQQILANVITKITKAESEG